MKKAICFFCLVLLLSIAGFQLYSLELTFACEDAQDFPSVMGNSSEILAENPGMAIEACQELEKRLDVTIKIIRVPWKRCLEYLKQGEVDGVFTASYKPEREEYAQYPKRDGKIDPSRSFTTATYALYRTKGSKASYDGSSFSNISGAVGAPRGYSIVADLRGKGLEVDESPNTKTDFLKLINNRLAAVAALAQTGDYLLKQETQFGEAIEKVQPSISEKPYYFILSHQFVNQNKDMAEKIWDTIGEIREDPTFQSKLGKYLD